MEPIKYRAKRIDNREWAYGYFFISPLTNETGEADSFLSGVRRNQIANENGVVFEIDIETLEKDLDPLKEIKKVKYYKIYSAYYWLEIRIKEFIYKLKK